MATATKKATTAATKTASDKPAASKPAPKAKTAIADDQESAFAFSSATTDQYDALMNAFTENAGALQEHGQEFLDAARAGFETAQDSFQAVNDVAVAAVQTEMSEAVDFTNELSRATSLNDVIEIQRDYWTRFFEGRVERTRAMTDATVNAMRDSAEPFNKPIAASLGTSGFASFFPFASK